MNVSNFIDVEQVCEKLLPGQLGISEQRYQFFLSFMFDRTPVEYSHDGIYNLIPGNPPKKEDAFTQFEWLALTIVCYARSRHDLLGRPISSLQIGLSAWCMGSLSDLAFDLFYTEPVDLPFLFKSLEVLWTDLMSQIIKESDFDPGGSGSMISYLAFMWFDGWIAPEALLSPECEPSTRLAFWNVFVTMLATQNRVVEAAAWHGISHFYDIIDDDLIHQELQKFLRRYEGDEVMCRYARAAAEGAVM